MGMIEETKSKAKKEELKAKGRKMEAEIQEMGAKMAGGAARTGEKIKKMIKK